MSEKSASTRNVLSWLFAIAILVGGIALFFLWRPGVVGQTAQTASAPLVEVAEVIAVHDALSIAQTGFVGPVDSVPVVAEVGGRAVFVNPDFSIGGTLSKGDTLFEIADDVYQADVARARADVNQATVRLTETSETLARQTELEESNFASEAALQGARTAQAQAKGSLELAQAQLETAQIALEDVSVKAPFDAVVTEKSVSPGQFLQPGVAVGEIALSNTVEVRIGLSERQFELVTGGANLLGRSVHITPRRLGPVMSDMPAREGVVVAVSPVLDPQSRTVEVLIHVPRQTEAGPALQFNQLVVAGFAIPSQTKPTLRAPRRALLRAQTIWHVTDAAQLARIDADIIRQTDQWVYFTADLDPGAQILLTVLDAPIDGMDVRVADNALARQMAEAAE